MDKIEKVYFDHNATTRVDDEVLEAMMPYFQNKFGNPSSGHNLGIASRQAINQARKQVADSIEVQPSQVVFTSGGSEANNLFIQGAAGHLKTSRIIVSAIEHPCVLRPAKELTQNTNEKRGLRQLMVDESGRVIMSDVDKALSEHPSRRCNSPQHRTPARSHHHCAESFEVRESGRCKSGYPSDGVVWSSTTPHQ